jgi:hypothetical protein
MFFKNWVHVKKIWHIPDVFLFSSFICLLAGCHHYQRNKEHSEISDAEIKKGEDLAVTYCQGCHVLPDPSLLDATTWEHGALPYMGPRLGIFSYGFDHYPSSLQDHFLNKNFYPSQPLLSPEDWKSLMNYYIATAPDSLPRQERPAPIMVDLARFRIDSAEFRYPHPATCFIRVDTQGGRRTLLVADVFKKNLLRYDDRLRLVDSVHFIGPIVDLDIQPGSMTACDIGILNPNNGKFGKAYNVLLGSDGKMTVDTIPLFDSLARPVQVTRADLNGDGLADYLICEFGNLTGELSWMENLGNGKFSKHILRPVPGAIKAYIRDDNHNGLPDLWVMFAQGDEGIFHFSNLGHGKFREESLLRFPPVYGSSYFELDDFNGDGYPDILYTCGDNADYSTILKPYHGVYIFLNDGKNHFSQKYFFPINGCYKAIARDFDGDGDLDLAVISFFADYAHQPDEGFVYLENMGNFQFKPHTLPAGKSGRWLTMDVGDLNGDGKPDIFLGNFSIAPGFIKPTVDWSKYPPFLYLENVGK